MPTENEHIITGEAPIVFPDGTTLTGVVNREFVLEAMAACRNQPTPLMRLDAYVILMDRLVDHAPMVALAMLVRLLKDGNRPHDTDTTPHS